MKNVLIIERRSSRNAPSATSLELPPSHRHPEIAGRLCHLHSQSLYHALVPHIQPVPVPFHPRTYGLRDIPTRLPFSSGTRMKIAKMRTRVYTLITATLFPLLLRTASSLFEIHALYIFSTFLPLIFLIWCLSRPYPR